MHAYVYALPLYIWVHSVACDQWMALYPCKCRYHGLDSVGYLKKIKDMKIERGMC